MHSYDAYAVYDRYKSTEDRIMKQLRTTLILSVLFLAGTQTMPAAAWDSNEPAMRLGAMEESIRGNWYSSEKQLAMQMYKTESGWQGKSTAATTQDLVGKWILRDLKFDNASGSYKGTLVPPDSSKHIDATVKLLDDNTLEIVGKVLVFTKTIVWTRKP
jgi:uncharacterized protein (DUF2147 family)